MATLKNPPKTGRPTKYNQRMQEQAERYVEQNDYPLLSEMAIQLCVDQDTITNWGKVHPVFFGTIKKLKDKAEAWLIRDGLQRRPPP